MKKLVALCRTDMSHISLKVLWLSTLHKGRRTRRYPIDLAYGWTRRQFFHAS
jgi:hypothetical protein